MIISVTNYLKSSVLLQCVTNGQKVERKIAKNVVYT